MSNFDPYELLSVNKNASDTEIKKAYRKQALKYHPDRNPDDKVAEEKFRDVTKAYEVLSDPQKRAHFDQYGRVMDDNGAGHGGGGDFSSTIFEEFFGDAFGDFFGGGARTGRQRKRPSRGSHIEMSLEIDFLDAAFGTSRKIKVPKTLNCKRCDGSGAEPGGLQTCTTCNGMGQVTRQQGFFSVATTCPSCNGKGQMIKEVCKDCSGRGIERQEKEIEVKVPAGIEDEMTLRVNGEGNAGQHGGPPGDLYVHVRVKEHQFFERDGRDISLELPVSFIDATLGKTLNIPTLKDSESITIKPGTQPGDQIVLKGKGIPDVKGYGIGNLYVNVKVILPTKLNKKQKELLEKFSKESTEDTYKQHKSLWDKMKNIFQ